MDMLVEGMAVKALAWRFEVFAHPKCVRLVSIWCPTVWAVPMHVECMAFAVGSPHVAPLDKCDVIAADGVLEKRFFAREASSKCG